LAEGNSVPEDPPETLWSPLGFGIIAGDLAKRFSKA